MNWGGILPPKKTAAGSDGTVQSRRSPKKTASTHNRPNSSNEEPSLKSNRSRSSKDGLKTQDEQLHSSNEKLKKPRKTSAASQKTGFVAMPQPQKESGNIIESAASCESPPQKGRVPGDMHLVTALVFYLIFAFVLLTINLWNPVNTVVSTSTSTSAGPVGTVDLTGRQIEFEAEWRRKLQELDINSQALSQTISSRLREEDLGALHPNNFVLGNEQGLVKWIRSEVEAVFPESENEAQLVKTGGAWKEICQSMGFVISKTTWGYTHHTLWVVLDSEADIEPGGRRLSLPMQKITLKQPLRGGPRKNLNWRGLVPENPPALAAAVPKPVTTIAPNRQPILSPKPVPTVNPGSTPVPLPSPSLIPSPAPLPSAKPPKIKVRAKVAIIIDDVGATHDESTEAFFQVPARLTWSVMPLMPYGDHYMAAGKDHGFEIMLHLPLEPLDAKINPGPGIIKASWPEEEIRQKLDEDLKSVPDAVGINNHMGSAGTSDDRLMNILMQAIKEKGLYFVDSMTYKTSVAGTYARLYQVPFGKRKVFIDNQSSVESKKNQLRELIKTALKDGSAIGIGHVRPNTAEAIIQMLPEFFKAGVVIVPVSELVR